MSSAEGRGKQPIAIGLTLVLLGVGAVAYEAAAHTGNARSNAVGLTAAGFGTTTGPAGDDAQCDEDDDQDDQDDDGADDGQSDDSTDDGADDGQIDDSTDDGADDDQCDDEGDDQGDDDGDDQGDGEDDPGDDTPTAAPTTAAPAPSKIDPPAGSRIVGTADVVTGTQTYTCAAGTFVGTNSVPEAALSGSIGEIHHFGGPSWQSVDDKSLVTATKTAFSDVTGSIPELLLTVNSHSGTGVMSDIAFIQRLKTSGGAAPTAACTDGEKATVPYKATYVFLSAS